MPIKVLFNNTFKLLEKYLDIAKERHELITENIANLDTPNYRPRDINFKETLKAVMENQYIRLFRTKPKHLNMDKESEVVVEVSEENRFFNNTNGVDIDREMVKLAENNLMYRTGVEILLRKLSILKYTITEGGK